MEDQLHKSPTWVVVKIMVPFGSLIQYGTYYFGYPKKGTIILTTTALNPKPSTLQSLSLLGQMKARQQRIAGYSLGSCVMEPDLSHHMLPVTMTKI